ncbi:hypothetical protein ABKN59_002659 [Abortiporus biennis]
MVSYHSHSCQLEVYGELASKISTHFSRTHISEKTTGWRNVCQKSPLLQFTELCKASVEAPLDSCGVLRPGFEAKTLCEDGHHPDGGEAGDLYLSNSQLTLGYYRDDKATREAFVNGWLQSGDRFRANENAVLYFVERSKNTLKVQYKWLRGGSEVIDEDPEKPLPERHFGDCFKISSNGGNKRASRGSTHRSETSGGHWLKLSGRPCCGAVNKIKTSYLNKAQETP